MVEATGNLSDIHICDGHHVAIPSFLNEHIHFPGNHLALVFHLVACDKVFPICVVTWEQQTHTYKHTHTHREKSLVKQNKITDKVHLSGMRTWRQKSNAFSFLKSFSEKIRLIFFFGGGGGGQDFFSKQHRTFSPTKSAGSRKPCSGRRIPRFNYNTTLYIHISQ